MQRRLGTRTVLCAALLAVGSFPGATALAHQQQRVEGHVLVFYGALAYHPGLAPERVIEAVTQAQLVANGHISYGFNVDTRTVGGSFSLARTSGEGGPFGVVFFDQPVGRSGARAVGYVDEHAENGIEIGAVPAGAKSAYVFTHHQIDQQFRYVATK